MKVLAVVVVIACVLAAQVEAQQRKHYCGRRLDRKLLELCGGIYNKRAGDAGTNNNLGTGLGDLEEMETFLAVMSGGGGKVRQRRGIVEECCRRGCTDWELSLYCLDDIQ